MKAYLTSSVFQYLDRPLFNSCLLFYPKLYLPIDPKSVKWTELDRVVLEQIHGVTLTGQFAWGPSSEDRDLSIMALKLYFQNNPLLFTKVRDRLEYMRELDQETSEFFRGAIEIPLQHAGGTPIFSANVLHRVFQIAEQRKRTHVNRDLDWKDHIDCCMMTQDLFISNYMARRHNMDAVMLVGEAALRAELLASEDSTLWDDPDATSLSKFFPINSLHALLGWRAPAPRHFSLDISEVLVPNLSSIPLNDLIEFIARDRPRPIALYVADLIEKYGYGIQKGDIVNEVITQLLAVAKVLWPTVGDVAIGLVGNCPSPILLNPIGIWDWFKGAFRKQKVDKEYAWVLAVKDLRAMTQHAGKDPNHPDQES